MKEERDEDEIKEGQCSDESEKSVTPDGSAIGIRPKPLICKPENVSIGCKSEPIETKWHWAPGAWQDATRTSAFQPYKVLLLSELCETSVPTSRIREFARRKMHCNLCRLGCEIFVFFVLEHIKSILSTCSRPPCSQICKEATLRHRYISSTLVTISHFIPWQVKGNLRPTRYIQVNRALYILFSNFTYKYCCRITHLYVVQIQWI